MKEKLEVWKYFKGLHKVYTENKETMKALIKNKDYKLSSTYYKLKTGKKTGWDIIIPSSNILWLKKVYTFQII